jgi:hypothetical protein
MDAYERKHIIYMLEGMVYNGFTLIEDATHVTFYLGDNEYSVDVVRGNFKWRAPTNGKYTLFIYSGQIEDKYIPVFTIRIKKKIKEDNQQ